MKSFLPLYKKTTKKAHTGHLLQDLHKLFDDERLTGGHNVCVCVCFLKKNKNKVVFVDELDVFFF